MQAVIAGLIVTHARLAEAFGSAVASITGVDEGLASVSNKDLDATQLRRRIHQHLDELHGSECIVFVDFQGGSCALAVASILRGYPNVRAVIGLNLPMLIDFVLRREDFAIDDLVQRIVERGKKSVDRLEG